MKRMYVFIAAAMLCLLLNIRPAKAQSNELVQLILNVEKLEQLKSVLKQMYSGYEMLTKAYQAITNISKGNFDLHKVFLDQLLEVSPLVRNYFKVASIISMQATIVQEYKSAFARCRSMNVFSATDIQYLEEVYSNLTSRSARSLDELMMVVTAGQTRMTDAERMAFIDDIHASVTDQLSFLRYFNNKALVLGTHKQQGLEETTRLRNLFGLQ